MKTVTLAEIVSELESGGRPPGGACLGDGVVSVGGEHLNGEGGFRFENIRRIPHKYFQQMNKGRILTKDILIVKDGATTGKVGFVREDFLYPESAVNEHVFRMKIDERWADPIYVFRFLQSPSGQAGIMSDFRGSTIGGIGRTFLQRVRLPLPTLAEQHRIAIVLDKADEICRKRQGMASLVNEIQGSVFNEMFGDPVSNSKGWPRDSFGNLGELDRGRLRHRPRNAPQLYGGPYPFIQTGDVANCQNYIREYQQTYSELGLQQSRLWKAGTLCITIAANIAKTGILTFDACFPDSIVGFQPCDRVSIEYVHYWLKFMQQRLENAAPESAQKNINLEILRKLSVPVPPIVLQKKFSRLVSQTNKLSQQLDRSMHESENMFNSLQRELF